MHEDVRTNTRTYMSVKEMGELLGLGRTESYWLINKKYFPSATRYGKTWVELAGFEDWYANQVKYRKKNGEEPGIMLRERSYSAKELAQLLSISESAAYELIKKNLFRTTTHNGWMRVPKDSFWKWYKGQNHYRTQEDREKDKELESSSLSFADMGKYLGISRDKAYHIVKSKKYGSIFESIMLAGKPRITKESFEIFLKEQNKYRLCTGNTAKAELPGSSRSEAAVEKTELPRASTSGSALPEAAPPRSGHPKEAMPEPALTEAAVPGSSRNFLQDDGASRYITLAEAAEMAEISRQAVSGYANQGCFLIIKKGRNVRLGRHEFCKWLEARKQPPASQTAT